MERDLITIIVPTYKRSHKIKKALDSIARQTYSTIEVIVVDDNADFPKERKETERIVKQFPNVKLVQNKRNLGGALARNVGINLARGSLIAFLDDDDEYKPTKIQRQYELFQKVNKKNFGIIICNKDRIAVADYRKDALYEEMMKHTALTSTWLVSKNALKDVGYFTDSPSEQDAILMLKLLAKGYKLYAVPENLVVFARHDDEETISGHKKKNIVGLEEYRNWCRNFYSLLDDKVKINNVEYCLSRRLLTLKLMNGLRGEAFWELVNMVKRKPINLSTYRGVLKFLFPFLLLQHRNRSR